MASERQRRIELLARRNLAKREHPYYITELSHILKHPIAEADVLDLEETDRLFSRFDKGARSNDSNSFLKTTWPLALNSPWIRTCLCLADRLGPERVALFAGPYSTCGAILTKAEHALVNALSILEFDRDTLRLQSLSSESGLYLDLYEEKAEQWVEMKVWGTWISAAQGCLTEARI